MKVFLLAVLVALATAAPVDEAVNAVDVVINGVPEGQALEIGDIVDIKLKEHVDGQLAATADLLHPYTAVGIAEAAVVAEPVESVIPVQVVDNLEVAVPLPVIVPQPEIDSAPVIVVEQPVYAEIPAPVVLPDPAGPEIIPAPVVLPEPALPEVIPSPIVLPTPVMPGVAPPPAVLPEPVAPEVVEEIPVPAPQIPNGEIYNDGTVQVQVNVPEDAGVLASLQSWFNMVLNYFNQGVQTTQQII